MKLWQLLAGVPLTGEPYSQEMEITSISYDTRTLLPGALFVALFFAAGYFVGAFQNKTELIKGWINRLFPPKGE